jgi:Gram-negative bacterial TonB protein C-terminal
VITVTAFGQQVPDPRLTAAGLPQYPPLARLAQIQGEVKLEFLVDPNGEPVTVPTFMPQIPAGGRIGCTELRMDTPNPVQEGAMSDYAFGVAPRFSVAIEFCLLS